LLNSLPAPPGRSSIAELAAKLRPHPTFRRADGRMLGLKSIERRLRDLCDHPEIGFVVRPPEPGSNLPTRLFWRKPRGPRG
jgi:hypothetical protein